MFAVSLPAPFGIVFAIVIGLCMGSFSSVVLARSEREESIGGRSRCPYCTKSLGIFELIPLVSYLVQRGKCRGCGTHITLRYPLLELFGAVAFLAGWALMDGLVEGLALGLVLWAMGVIIIADLTEQMIPDLLTGLLAAGALVLHSFDAFVPALLAGVVGGAFLGAQWLVSRGAWVGSGDVLLMTALGLFVGRWEFTVIALGIAYMTGAVYAAGLLLSKGSAAQGMHIPFGPFLIAGALLSFLAGEEMVVAFAGML